MGLTRRISGQVNGCDWVASLFWPYKSKSWVPIAWSQVWLFHLASALSGYFTVFKTSFCFFFQFYVRVPNRDTGFDTFDLFLVCCELSEKLITDFFLRSCVIVTWSFSNFWRVVFSIPNNSAFRNEFWRGDLKLWLQKQKFVRVLFLGNCFFDGLFTQLICSIHITTSKALHGYIKRGGQ